MFELKYSITESDMAAVNKKQALFYFYIYLAVAIVGIAVGVVAVALNPQTSILVLGIIILALSAFLLAISLLILVGPKNLVASALPTSGDELNVTIDKNGITVGDKNLAQFIDITKVKNCKTYLLAYVGKNVVFIIKDAIVAGGSFADLAAYMQEHAGRMLLTPPETPAGVQTEGQSDTPAPELGAESGKDNAVADDATAPAADNAAD